MTAGTGKRLVGRGMIIRLCFHLRKVEETGCWVWTGFLNKGYGRVNVAGKIRDVHRVAYEFFVGPVPDGLDLDHVCRNRACANPEHLEPVSRAENLRRGINVRRETKACPAGHLYTEENTMTDSYSGARRCRICRKATTRRKYLRSKENAPCLPT